MNTKDQLTTAAIVSLSILMSCGCGKKSITGTTPADEPIPGKPNSVIGSEFFPHEVGRVWTLRNEQHPDRITTISMINSNGALAMFFQKNHPDTYHGAEGTNNNLIWYLRDDRGWIYPGNTTGGPDDIRVSRVTGKDVMHIWLKSSDATPVCFLIPTGNFTVPSEKHGTFSYNVQILPGNVGYPSPHGLWFVRWDIPTNDPSLLRIRFDETYSDADGFIMEDWYLRRGVGLVGIRQWYDSARTQLRRSIVSENIPMVSN